MAQAIYRKYRPMTFAQVSGQEHVKTTIQNQLKTGKTAHAYLFSGPRGVGKTTIARLIAKSLNCTGKAEGEAEPCGECQQCVAFQEGKLFDVMEIDAASHTGVDNVRENIIEAVRVAPSQAAYKVFIIDEVHMLSTSAFNALLKTLEEPPAHVVFVLATTEPHKIPQTIISRCQRFNFHRIASDVIVARLQELVSSENISVDNEVLRLIARQSEGCLRDAESLLGQVLALGAKNVTLEEASLVVPVTHVETILTMMQHVTGGRLVEALEVLDEQMSQGVSMKRLMDEMIETVREYMMFTLGAPVELDEGLQTGFDLLKTGMTTAHARELLDRLLGARQKRAPELLPQLPLELALVQFAQQHAFGKKEVVVEEVEETSKKKDQPDVEDAQELDLEELVAKWNRCCEVVAKTNVALPLALKEARPVTSEKGVVQLGFRHQFHFDTMSQVKNLDVLQNAIKQVMQVSVIVRPVIVKDQVDVAAGELAEAFGGSVVG